MVGARVVLALGYRRSRVGTPDRLATGSSVYCRRRRAGGVFVPTELCVDVFVILSPGGNRLPWMSVCNFLGSLFGDVSRNDLECGVMASWAASLLRRPRAGPPV